MRGIQTCAAALSLHQVSFGVGTGCAKDQGDGTSDPMIKEERYDAGAM